MVRTLIFMTSVFFIFSCQTRQQLSPYQQEIKSFRQSYLQSFLKEERSPLEKSDVQDLNFYQADSAYRFQASYTLLPNEIPFDLPTSSSKTKPYRKYAKLEFSFQDSLLILYVYESMNLLTSEEYEDYLFLPFTDLTSGESTYGGGRYLDLNKSDFKEATVVLDFNKCYNPWCAYSDGYSCPVPPSENHLNIPIFAGEMNFTGVYKSKQKVH